MTCHVIQAAKNTAGIFNISSPTNVIKNLIRNGGGGGGGGGISMHCFLLL